MKKKFFAALVAIAAITTGSLFAQNQTTPDKSKQQAECCQNDKKVKPQVMRPKFNPFDGVQLTDDQQQRLQVLRQGLGPVKLSKEEMKNLSDEQKKQLKTERKAKKAEAKKNYLNGVKEILTPDQYIIFLENCYLYSPEPMKATDKKFQKGPKGEKKDHGKKDGKKEGKKEGKKDGKKDEKKDK